MKPYICLLLTFLFGLPMSVAQTEPSPTKQDVTYVIPIRGVIEPGLLTYVVRKGVEDALSAEAGVIIFDMDTPGGAVDSAEEIMRILIDLPGNVRTYTLVNKDALSAGALIAIATDEIYMTPGARIGASAVISITGDLPEGDLKEKVYSSTVSLAVRAAKGKGHDPKLVEAMIRKEMEYKIGDEVICPAGQLLTLTDLDASKPVGDDENKKPLLAKGTVKNLDDLLEKINRSETTIVHLNITWSEEIARWIKTFRILILIGALVCFYIEAKIPGFGVPGITGILLLAVFFWGHHIAGLAGMTEIVLFVIGLTLLLVEIFVIPGFGITGITGIVMIVASLLMAMVQHYPGLPWYQPPAEHVQNAIIALGGALVVAFGLSAILARFLPESSLFSRLVLSEEVSSRSGYQASENTESLVGLTGEAATPLRPAGIGLINGKRMNVIARGQFVEKAAPIVIAETHGNRIIVEALESQDQRQNS